MKLSLTASNSTLLILSKYFVGSHGGAPDVNTTALTTNLAVTTDLNVVAVNLSQISTGIPAPQTSSIPLARALEELFQNVTVSLFSHTLFLTNVTIYTSYNEYVYSPGHALAK